MFEESLTKFSLAECPSPWQSASSQQEDSDPSSWLDTGHRGGEVASLEGWWVDGWESMIEDTYTDFYFPCLAYSERNATGLLGLINIWKQRVYTNRSMHLFENNYN